MSDDLDNTLSAVGPRLKRLRLRRDVTLADLAEQTGISASTLSRLEAGLRRPTLEQLLPLARVHGVTLDELVDAPPTGDPRLNLRPVAGADGSTILPLTRRPGGIQA
ncbi:transcriptional regulator with XRE-family HTH domain [Arthrobacter sp. MW3 TE3886]